MWGFSKDSVKGQLELFDLILKNDTEELEDSDMNNIDINSYDGILPHPLVYALYNNCSLQAFKKLIDIGADVNNQDILTGTLPIHHAASLGRLDIVRHLIERKSSVDVPDQIAKRTPLHSAVEKGFIEVTKYLCENGADVNNSDMDGFTPLHTAVETGNIGLVELLLCYTTDINFQNRFTRQTALHLACQMDNSEIIIKLIRRGAKPDIEDIYGKTPIELVREQNKFFLSKIMEKFDGKIIEGGVSIKGNNISSDEEAVG